MMAITALTAPAGMLVFTFTMVYAGLADLTTMAIKNRLVLLLLLAYVVLAPLAGFTVYEMGWSVAAAAGVLALTFALFAFGWIGGGDAKLGAVTALWLGVDHTGPFLVYTAIVGCAFTLGIVLFRMQPLPAWLGTASWISRLHSRTSGIPYGVAMAIAALLLFPETRWVTTLF